MADAIPAIRILPMSTEEFSGNSAEEVQTQFFLTELPSRESGRYFFRTAGLKADSGTVVLFQYDKKIIAYATFVEREQFAQPKDEYRGTLNFEVSSIRVFEPVGAQQMQSIWPNEFKGFSHAKTQLNADSFGEFERQLTFVQSPPSIYAWTHRFVDSVDEALGRNVDERQSRLAGAPILPKRSMATVWVFERNPDVVAEVLERAGGFCEECKQNAPFKRRSNRTPYLEVHHKKRLADGGEDTVENAIALCPNCHRQAHYG